MTAEDARELGKGSLRCKGPVEKLTLWWACGILNKRIEKNAEVGDTQATFTFRSRRQFMKYFPLIKEAYKKRGFRVSGDAEYFHCVYINWDK